MRYGILLIAILFSLSSCAPTHKVRVQYRSLDVEAFEKYIARENVLLVDVRTAEEFAAGHIPGAVNIPNEAIGTDEIPELPDKDQLIMVYCRSGRRSKEAAEKLVKLGYTNIVEFGGILDWKGGIVTD